MSESELDCVIDRISKYILEENQKIVTKLLREFIERAQDESFMKGYEYAIQLLQESMIKHNS